MADWVTQTDRFLRYAEFEQRRRAEEAERAALERGLPDEDEDEP